MVSSVRRGEGRSDEPPPSPLETQSVTVSDWAYLKLYLGEAFDRCDALIVSLLPELLRLEAIDRWFFLRYVDERGFHLRLRFRARADRVSALSEQATTMCRRALQQLPSLPASDYYPMVPPSDRIFKLPPGVTTGIETDRYEPEHDKFGGERGMPISEDLFEASSRIALEVLREEDRGILSRKTIAPCLMQGVADAFGADNADFWQDYSFYWLGSRTPVAYDTRERFFENGRKLNTDGVPIVPSSKALHESAREIVETWRHQVRKAANAYARACDMRDVTPDVLAFNFAHLMNNRLGLYAMEEAYLAALLEQRARNDFAA